MALVIEYTMIEDELHRHFQVDIRDYDSNLNLWVSKDIEVAKRFKAGIMRLERENAFK